MWSSIYAGLDDGKRELSTAIPSGSGLLLVALDFEGLAERLYSTVALTDTNLALTDTGGTYIVHPDQARVDRRETDTLLVRERLSAPNQDSYEYLRHEDGASWIVRAERIPEIGWFTIVQRPADFALSAFASSVALVSILTLAAVAAASGFAVFATRRLLEDVRVAGAYAESAGISGFMPSPDSLYFRETRAIHDGISAALQLLRDKDVANERLGSLNLRLTQALDELSKAQSALVESGKLAILGRLAATVAHDLNTPIGAASASALAAMELSESLLAGSVGLQETECPEAAVGVQAITLAVGVFDPAAALVGSQRRQVIRQAEDILEAWDSAAAYDLASRLVDIGMYDLLAFQQVCTVLCRGGASVKCLDQALAHAELLVSTRIVVNAIDVASSVVAALKAYVKGGLDAAPEVIDLVGEFKSILALLGTRLRRSVDVNLESTGNPLVYGRRDSLNRVWMNLLLNALEAMAYKGSLAIRIRQDEGLAVVEIEDNGPGIPEGLLAEIWKPFFTTKTDSQGTGLGLPMVKETLESLGGWVEVASQPGRTVFSVHLPLHIEVQPGAEPTAQAGTP